MGCSCGGKRAQFQVVTENGKVVFTGTKATADAVAKRYANSTVQEAGTPTAAKSVPEPSATP
jgi:hypothetical protein